MGTDKLKSKHQGDIPVEPQVLALLSQGLCDKEIKNCMLTAVDKYNITCEKAYDQLIKDLKSCLLKKSL